MSVFETKLFIQIDVLALSRQDLPQPFFQQVCSNISRQTEISRISQHLTKTVIDSSLKRPLELGVGVGFSLFYLFLWESYVSYSSPRKFPPKLPYGAGRTLKTYVCSVLPAAPWDMFKGSQACAGCRGLAHSPSAPTQA